MCFGSKHLPVSSYKAIPVATATLRESPVPDPGIWNKQLLSNSLKNDETPCDSFPTIKPKGDETFILLIAGLSSSVATKIGILPKKTIILLISDTLFSIAIIDIRKAAPIVERITLGEYISTQSPIKIICWMPNHSQVRMIVPTLPGSETLSNATKGRLGFSWCVLCCAMAMIGCGCCVSQRVLKIEVLAW